MLRHVAHGETNQQIGLALGISEATARTHVSNILGKLHLASRTQAALYALRAGLASLDVEDLSGNGSGSCIDNMTTTNGGQSHAQNQLFTYG